MEKNILRVHFTEEALAQCKKSVKTVLVQCTNDEVKYLQAAISEGRINGCSSVGERRCFFGTLAQFRGVEIVVCKEGFGLPFETVSDIEYFFFQICSSSANTRQTPENNTFAFLLLIWLDEVVLSRSPKDPTLQTPTL